jgi:hypothetical protein
MGRQECRRIRRVWASSGKRLRPGPKSALAALALCSVLAACSPYVFSDNTQAFSKAMASIDTSYKDTGQKIQDEQQQAAHIEWIRDRPRLMPGPGCKASAADSKGTEPCDIVRPDQPQAGKLPVPEAPAPKAKPPADVCQADPEALPVDVEVQAKKAAKLSRTDLLKAVDNYIAALAAVSNAQDRTDFDNAAAKVSAAVGTLVQTAAGATPAAPAAGTAGAVAKATTNAVLWLVGQGLDYQRLQELRRGTEAACEPMHVLSKAIAVVLEEQRGNRLDGLRTLVILEVQAVNMLGARATAQAYGSAIDDSQAAANAYQTVRVTDPQAMGQALSDAHDALVVAVRNNNGEFAALVASLEAFGQRVGDIATAASTSSRPQPAAAAKPSAPATK